METLQRAAVDRRRIEAERLRLEEEERLAQEEVTGESGGGMVKVVMIGRYEVKRIAIDPSLMGDDREMLEELGAAAGTSAGQRVAERTQDSMAGITAGMPLPPGFKMPF